VPPPSPSWARLRPGTGGRSTPSWPVRNQGAAMAASPARCWQRFIVQCLRTRQRRAVGIAERSARVAGLAFEAVPQLPCWWTTGLTQARSGGRVAEARGLTGARLRYRPEERADGQRRLPHGQPLGALRPSGNAWVGLSMGPVARGWAPQRGPVSEEERAGADPSEAIQVERASASRALARRIAGLGVSTRCPFGVSQRARAGYWDRSSSSPRRRSRCGGRYRPADEGPTSRR
jgi:hypothetical protein